jgi:hypothetical protein
MRVEANKEGAMSTEGYAPARVKEALPPWVGVVLGSVLGALIGSGVTAAVMSGEDSNVAVVPSVAKGSQSEPDASGDGLIPGPGRPLIDLFDPSQDLLSGGRVVSVAGAARMVPYQMYLPSDAALPPPEVWVLGYNAEDGTPSYDAAARFDASVVVTYAVWTNGRDPATEYQKMYAETPIGYLMTISGNPARVVPAGSPQTIDPRISVVNLSIGDVEVTLFGRVPVDELIQYASTLQPV